MTHKNVQNYYNEKCAKYLMFDVKSKEELSFMTLKGDAKLEEKLICGLENDTRNMAKFSPEQLKICLKIGILMGSFNPK